MIEEKLHLKPHKLVLGNLSQELLEYKKLNFQLLKQIKEKDQKIERLFTLIQDNKKPRAHTTKSTKKRNPYFMQITNLLLSQNTHKEKENKHSILGNNNNVIKKHSISSIEPKHHQQTFLPFIDKRSNNIFQKEDCMKENTIRQFKIVRIPLQRLKPLNKQEIQKRFLLKLNKNEEQNQ